MKKVQDLQNELTKYMVLDLGQLEEEVPIEELVEDIDD